MTTTAADRAPGTASAPTYTRQIADVQPPKFLPGAVVATMCSGQRCAALVVGVHWVEVTSRPRAYGWRYDLLVGDCLRPVSVSRGGDDVESVADAALRLAAYARRLRVQLSNAEIAEQVPLADVVRLRSRLEAATRERSALVDGAVALAERQARGLGAVVAGQVAEAEERAAAAWPSQAT